MSWVWVLVTIVLVAVAVVLLVWFLSVATEELGKDLARYNDARARAVAREVADEINRRQEMQ